MKLRILEVEAEGQDIAEIVRAALGMSGEKAVLPPPIATAIPEPSAEQVVTEERRPKRRNVGAKTQKAISAPDPVSAPRSASGGGDTIPARILEALKKKPMSSVEIGQALKLELTQVYPACSQLKQRGQVDSRNDEPDGTRRYFAK